MDLSLGDKEVTQLHILLCVIQITDKQWPITETLKEYMSGHDHDTHLFLHGDSWTEKLAAKFVLYAVIHS